MTVREGDVTPLHGGALYEAIEHIERAIRDHRLELISQRECFLRMHNALAWVNVEACIAVAQVEREMPK